MSTGQRFWISLWIEANTAGSHVGMPWSVRAWTWTIAAPAS